MPAFPKHAFFVLAVATLSLPPAADAVAKGSPEERHNVPRVVSPPVIDGALSDACWKRIRPLGRFQRDLDTPANPDTIVRVGADAQNLYIAIEALDRRKGDLKADATQDDSENIFNDDSLEIFIDPTLSRSRYFHITINPRGTVFDEFVTYPGPKMHKSWQSRMTVATGRSPRSWTVEARIPRAWLGLTGGAFGFNAGRNRVEEVVRQAGKTEAGQRSVALERQYSILAHTGQGWHRPWLFLPMQIEGEPPPVPEDSEGRMRQMVHGMAGYLKSLDALRRATHGIGSVFGEGCDVVGTTAQHDYVSVGQFPSKADGYFRFGRKGQMPEYRDLACEYLGYLHQVLTNTVDVQKKHWLPYTQYVTIFDDVIRGYDEGPAIDLWSHPIRWDQTKAEFQVKSYFFPDAFGVGMLDLSEFRDEMPPETRTQILEILEAQMDFYHRGYVLKEAPGEYFFRTDDFFPHKPQMPIPKPEWGYMGQDVVYLFMAYVAFGGNDDRYWRSMDRFADYYMEIRPGLPADTFWIDRWDNRMADLGEFLSRHDRGGKLARWVRKKVPGFYPGLIEPSFMFGGSLHDPSSVPTLDLFLKTSPGHFRSLWQRFEYEMGPFGIMKDNTVPSINASAFPPFLDYCHKAWQRGMLSDAEEAAFIERMWLFFGDRRILLDTEWWTDAMPFWDTTQPWWSATPYPNYVSGIHPEALFKGTFPQAFVKNFVPLDYYPRPYTHHTDLYQTSTLYQYCAPFQNHAEKFSYGKALTFNLLQMRAPLAPPNDQTPRKELRLVEEFTFPRVARETPCFGICDLTAVLFRQTERRKEAGLLPDYLDANGLRLRDVRVDGVSVPFETYTMLGSEDPALYADRVRAVFGARSEGKEETKRVEFVFRPEDRK